MKVSSVLAMMIAIVVAADACAIGIMMSSFWERKRAEYQGQHQQPYTGPVGPSDGPWWAKGTQLIPQQGVQDQQPYVVSQSQPGYPADFRPPQPNEPGYVAYRLSQPATADATVSRATQLNQTDFCPSCGSGNFMKPPDSSRARRCFNCGFVEGRSVHDMAQPLSAVTDSGGVGRHARQLNQQGFRGNISSGNEAVQTAAMLEMSAMGRSSV